ncbi:hypothetical protein OBBRIDRAFT_776390 [Obba rivulosa]|uniref:Alpha/beta hydrolase fold-3 domain-containing protein n=1 Tax=Obba rivulosa TaxID=1052685 RepID=A0A8E2DJU6_9APHY|nr:hypothetical protein OBBRIDRAFT_776390 [Obba rivulosa]
MSEDRQKLSQPDPEYAAILASTPLPRPPKLDIKVLREILHKDMAARTQEIYGPRLPAKSEYRVEDHMIPVEGAQMALRCLIPIPRADKGQTFPLFYWIHGGAGRLGTIELDDLLLRTICVEFQITVVNIEYRLAPEYKFPVGVNDTYAGLKWAAEHASQLSADLAKGFIVGGASAGGYLTAVVTHRALDDPFFVDRPLTAQILCIPMVIHPDAYPEKYKSELQSVEELATSTPTFNKEDLYESYNDQGSDPFNPESSPLLYISHTGLPPTYFQVCGLDLLRDEGLLYERLLREAGITTKLDVYPGVPHGFHLFFPKIKQAVKYEEDFRKGLAWLLNGAKADEANV